MARRAARSDPVHRVDELIPMKHGPGGLPMRRVLALLLVAAAIAPGTWLRDAPKQASRILNLRFTALPLPPRAEVGGLLGPFTLESAWRMDSTHVDFGGYSALLPRPHGGFLAISDRAFLLRFSPPGAPHARPSLRTIFRGPEKPQAGRDSESATTDPATDAVWIGWEYRNAISRFDPDLSHSLTVAPRAMRDWGTNSGPEAMVRLRDGRFIVLREGFSGWFEDHLHKAVRFSGDPVLTGEPEKFTFEGPAGFSPTDMAQLPDGRVLILMRSLVWPMPARFSGRIVVADPREIAPGRVWRGKELARLVSPLPVDNFEGLAIRPRQDGTVAVWLISDDNNAVAQRTLLWKLVLDPRDLK